MTEALPKPVQQILDAVGKGDTEAFLAAFPKEGVVNDWGSLYRGQDAIRAWSDREFIGAKGVMTVKAVRQSGDETTVDAGWKSNFFSGDSRFVFVVDGDHVAEMRITDAK